jgi:tRNA(Ile)-lysidine synthetase-like protein
MKKQESGKKDILAISGGPDSMYLFARNADRKENILAAHFNHKARGEDSENDQRFLERLCSAWGIKLIVGSPQHGEKRFKAAIGPGSRAGFEEKARRERRKFLVKAMMESGAKKILMAHTADDQVETVLMRILEGAGTKGLKGIPRKTTDGIERPLLDTWREDILAYLRMHNIPYRIDKSNMDTRFERNWIRHVLIPVLEERYGKPVRKRIFTLGERFRELDEFLDSSARAWIEGNVRHSVLAKEVSSAGKGAGKKVGNKDSRPGFRRDAYRTLPSVLRKKILQILSYERIGIAPNERLLEAMDRVIMEGGPSARLHIGKGKALLCRYETAFFDGSLSAKVRRNRLTMSLPGKYVFGGHEEIIWEERGKIAARDTKRMAKGEAAAVFDADTIALPLVVRTLKHGDRIRPFGLDAEKKIKEIMIDRKIPADERWGRTIICDGSGSILWIPGMIRSSLAAVTPGTHRTVFLRILQPNAISAAGRITT